MNDINRETGRGGGGEVGDKGGLGREGGGETARRWKFYLYGKKYRLYYLNSILFLFFESSFASRRLSLLKTYCSAFYFLLTFFFQVIFLSLQPIVFNSFGWLNVS